MPRNDQVTRQWHLIRTLEASREGVTLQGLARLSRFDGECGFYCGLAD
jgi:hypothetical protein